MTTTTTPTPFTADDIAFCQERAANWRARGAEDPVKWPTCGNLHIWEGVLAAITVIASGGSPEITEMIVGVAIDGDPTVDRRCRTLLKHMLAYTEARDTIPETPRAAGREAPDGPLGGSTTMGSRHRRAPEAYPHRAVSTTLTGARD